MITGGGITGHVNSLIYSSLYFLHESVGPSSSWKRNNFLIHFSQRDEFNEEISENYFAIIDTTSAISRTKSNKIQSTLDSTPGMFIYLRLILLSCFYWPH